MTVRIVNPPGLAPPVGYAHGVVVPAGRAVLHLGGQIGWDAQGVLEPDFIRQFARALANIVEVVKAAGGTPEGIVALRIHVLDTEEYRAARRELKDIWRGLLGSHYPAMTLVQVAGLYEPGARVEIDGTAVL